MCNMKFELNVTLKFHKSGFHFFPLCVYYFSIAELEKDMLQLRNNLKEVEREIEFHRVQPLMHGDRFLPVMKEFLTTATCRFSELEDLFQDMKTRVNI